MPVPHVSDADILIRVILSWKLELLLRVIHYSMQMFHVATRKAALLSVHLERVKS